MSRQIIIEINTHLNTKWRTKLESLNPQDNTLEAPETLKKTHKQIPTLTDNTQAVTDQNKANTLSNTFEQIHNLDIDDREEHTQMYHTVETSIHAQQNATPDRQTRNTLPHNKTPGHDGIGNIIFKNLSKKTFTQLAYIINAIYKLQHFP